MHTYCLYHADCADGMMSACIVQRYFGSPIESNPELTFLPVSYHEPMLELPLGARVIVVDFSYGVEDMKTLIRRADRGGVTLLDHHPRTEGIKAEVDQWLNTDPEGKAFRPYSFLYYDGRVSGAMITWEWLYSPLPPPALVRHVSDRDTWKFELPATKDVMAGLFTFPMRLDAWGDLLERHDVIAQCMTAAPVGLRVQEMQIQWTLDHTLRMIAPTALLKAAGITEPFPLVNCSHWLVSEVCGRLAVEHGIALAYWDAPEGRRFSIRSRERDIRPIARFFPGGDGHAKAAGFTVPRSHPLARL